MTRHRKPTALRNVALLDAAVFTAALIAAAINVAPHATRPAASAQPTVEQREPTGHGGPIGPLALPSPAAGLPVWTPEDGPVVVDGQPLEKPQPVTEPVEPEPVEEAAPAPEEPSSPAPVAEATPAPEQPATGLLALVNADRAEAGCGPVAIADDLTSQAQTHSNAQAAADSMFHSESGDRLAENVAAGYETEAEVHQAWLDSPDHRKNIETCDWTVMGYGSAVSASGITYWTEQFK